MMDEAARACPKIQVIREAVGDYCGTVSFSQAEVSDVSHIEPGATDQPAGSGVVPITTLDAFVERRGLKVTAVKIDVEGFDILVLEGAVGLAAAQRPIFSVEFGIEDGRANSWNRLADFLDDCNYRIWAVDMSFPDGKVLCRMAPRSMEELQKVWTKMLFVVPSENNWFARFTDKFPSWGKERLGSMRVEEWIP
jgi:FkbM family methyltransferase